MSLANTLQERHPPIIVTSKTAEAREGVLTIRDCRSTGSSQLDLEHIEVNVTKGSSPVRVNVDADQGTASAVRVRPEEGLIALPSLLAGEGPADGQEGQPGSVRLRSDAGPNTALSMKERGTDGSGWRGVRQHPLTVHKTSASLGENDGIAIFDGNQLTCTLPDPASSSYLPGFTFVVKNVHQSDLVLQANPAGTIDGAARLALRRWEVARITTDGERWLRV